MFISRSACPVCDSNNFREILCESYSSGFLQNYLLATFEKRGKAEPSIVGEAVYSVCECNDCQLIFQKNIPNQQLSFIIYAEWIKATKLFTNKVQKRRLGYYQYLSRMVERMMHHLDKRPSTVKVYDFGMGWGDFCAMCQAFGSNAVGTELAPQKVSYANSLGIKNIELDDIPGEEFDMVNANQVFEHLDEPVKYIRKLAKCLNSKGILRIAVPNGNQLSSVLHKETTASLGRNSPLSLKLVAPLEHINCFTTASLYRLIELGGLTPIKLKRKNLLDYTFRNLKQIAFSGHQSSLELYCTKVAGS